MTYREMGNLIDGLPAESLTRTAQRNAFDDATLAEAAKEQTEHGQWSHTDLLLADLWDLIARVNHDPKKGDPPVYPRPGIAPAGGGRKGKLTRAQMEEYERRRRIAHPSHH